MKLIEDFKMCRGNRKEYRVKPTIKFMADTRDYYFSIFPTILWMPWFYRYPNTTGVIDIWWLHFHILIGKWERFSCSECTHRRDCVESGRLEWYSDDVFEKGEKCPDFETR